MPRLFVSCEIFPTPALRQLHRQLEGVQGGLRVSPMQNWHLTLKFLGDVEPTRIADIERIVNHAGTSARVCHPQLIGLDVFPNAGRPTVVWVGLEDIESLVELASRLETDFVPLGFAAESRSFQPHVTVARLQGRPPEALYELLAEHTTTEFGRIPVESIALMRSDLGARGPQYTTLSRVSLPVSDSAVDRSLRESPRPI